MIWNRLVSDPDLSKAATSLEFAEALKTCIVRNATASELESMRLLPALKVLLTEELSDYPWMDDQSAFELWKKSILQLASPPSTQKLLVSFLEEYIWELLVPLTLKTCSRCGDCELRALYLRSSKSIILSCDICCWSETLLGEQWTRKDEWLVPGTKSQLREVLVRA